MLGLKGTVKGLPLMRGDGGTGVQMSHRGKSKDLKELQPNASKKDAVGRALHEGRCSLSGGSSIGPSSIQRAMHATSKPLRAPRT